MVSVKSNCPPLTPDDVITLLGKPMLKMSEPSTNSFYADAEEWIYYNVKENIKEIYSFKNNKLTDYQTKEFI